jgi:hypothetical protein
MDVKRSEGSLDAFVLASDDDAEEQLGILLSTVASPIVGRVIASRLGGASSESDDVRAHVLLELMVRLRDGRVQHDLGAIDAFDAYVAAAAHHACDHYLRRKYPARWRLRNRIRYVLEHDRGFGMWKAPHGTWRCGLRDWQARATGVAPAVETLAGIDPRHVAALLSRIFERSGGPLELTTVVDLAATAWHVPLFQHEDAAVLEQLSDGASRADETIARRERAGRAWDEIRELPVRQRQALLLNIKDDALGLFVITGTASLDAIAAALEMTVEALADIWNSLPLADNELARRLGCTRQQVINLRMAARKRLLNRLEGRANIQPVRSLP